MRLLPLLLVVTSSAFIPVRPPSPRASRGRATLGAATRTLETQTIHTALQRARKETQSFAAHFRTAALNVLSGATPMAPTPAKLHRERCTPRQAAHAGQWVAQWEVAHKQRMAAAAAAPPVAAAAPISAVEVQAERAATWQAACEFPTQFETRAPAAVATAVEPSAQPPPPPRIVEPEGPAIGEGATAVRAARAAAWAAQHEKEIESLRQKERDLAAAAPIAAAFEQMQRGNEAALPPLPKKPRVAKWPPSAPTVVRGPSSDAVGAVRSAAGRPPRPVTPPPARVTPTPPPHAASSEDISVRAARARTWEAEIVRQRAAEEDDRKRYPWKEQGLAAKARAEREGREIDAFMTKFQGGRRFRA